MPDEFTTQALRTIMSTPASPGDPPAGVPRSRDGRLTAAFRYPDYRVLWASTVASQLGQGMQQVLLGWLAFDITDSAGMVGAVFAARSAPNLVVGFAAGPIADRFDRRSLMRLSGWATGLAAGGAAVLLFLGQLDVWHLLLAASALGALQSFYVTARQAYVYDLVGPSGALKGIGLISIAQQVGGVVGALLGGAVIQWSGPGTAFAATGAGYVLGATMLYGLRERGEAAPLFSEPVWQNLLSYLKALRTNRTMVILMGTTALSETVGFSHQVVLPALAKDVLHVGATGLGVLTAFRFAGGTLGVLTITALWRTRRQGLLLLGVLVGFGLGQVLLSQAVHFWMAVVVLTFINVMSSATDILHATLLQLSVPNEQRGRAMGSWIVGLGTSPGGQLEMGYLADAAGPRLGLLANGIALAGSAVLLGVLLPRLRRL
jgi:MFS family permease